MADDSQRSSLSASEFHGRLAADWERKYDERVSFRARERILAAILKRNCLPGSRWLDAGCGTGRFSRRLAEQGAECVVGLDASPRMLEVARNLAQARGLGDRITFDRCENLAKLPVESHTVDGILCSSVLEYLENPDEVLCEFRRVLKPDGCLIVSVPNRAALMRRVQNICFALSRLLFRTAWPAYLTLVRHQYVWPEASRLIRKCGFQVRGMRYGGSGFVLDARAFWGPLLFIEAVLRHRPVILAPIRSYYPAFKAGGPIQSLHALAEHLSKQFDFKLVTRDRDTGDTHTFDGIEPDVWSAVTQAEVMYLHPRSVNIVRLIQVINQTPHDLLYINSFFDPVFTMAPLFARKLKLLARCPVVLAPRGELAAGALALKTLKKRSYLAVAKLFRLFEGVWWQASCDGEKQEIIRELGLGEDDSKRVKVARDLAGMAVTNIPPTARCAKHSGVLRAVFLSRITPMKNLDWAILRLGAVRGDVSLDIYGPVSDLEYWGKCEKTIASVPQVNVTVHGAIPHETVVERLAAYDLFVFPTLGENFGHVILESLLAGCPVVVSSATPWQNLEQEKGGWVIPLELENRFVEVMQWVADMDEPSHRIWREGAIRIGQTALLDSQAVEDNRRLFQEALDAG